MSERTFDKGFYKKLLTLTIPVALQNLLATCANMVDTAMVTRLGNAEITAVGIAGKWTFIVTLIVWGMCTGVATQLSQYFGADDTENLNKTQALATVVALCVGVFFSAAMVLFPRQLISVYNTEPAVLDAGESYIRIVGAANIFSVLGCIFAISRRSIEDVKTPMIVSGISVALNSFLNYVLIYGHFGAPRLGVTGAAIATAVSFFIQPLIYTILGIRQYHYSVTCLPYIKKVDAAFFKKFISISSLTAMNEGLWSVGFAICAAIFAHRGSDDYAAYTVFSSIQELAKIFFYGLGAAASVLVGKAIGAGRHKLAYDMGLRIMIITHVFGTLFGLGMVFARKPLLSLFGITSQATFETASSLLLIYGLCNGYEIINYMAISGIFRAGGDVKVGLLLDMIGMYGFAVPVTFLLYKLGAPFIWLVAGSSLADGGLKGILCWKRFLSRKWIHQITKKEA